MRLALADALHFRCMQRIDLAASLMPVLFEHPLCQIERLQEDHLQVVFASDLSGDIADGAAEIGLELAKGLVGALELMGMGIALILNQGELAYPPIGLTQIDPELLGETDQLLARP